MTDTARRVARPVRADLRPKLIVEELEPRIAPTIIWSGGSFIWQDPDDVYYRVAVEGGTPAPYPDPINAGQYFANLFAGATYVDVVDPSGNHIDVMVMGDTEVEGTLAFPGDVDWYYFTALFNEDFLIVNGSLDPGEDLNGNGVLDGGPLTITVDTPGAGTGDFDPVVGLFGFFGEDLNGNSILDPGEDFNGNGVLDVASSLQLLAYNDNYVAPVGIVPPATTPPTTDNDAQILTYSMNNAWDLAATFPVGYARYWVAIANAPDGDPSTLDPWSPTIDPDYVASGGPDTPVLPYSGPGMAQLFNGNPVGNPVTGFGGYHLLINNAAIPFATFDEAAIFGEAGNDYLSANDIDGFVNANTAYIGRIRLFNSDLSTELTVSSGELDEDTGIFTWTPGLLASSTYGTPAGSGGAVLLGVGYGRPAIEALAVYGPDPDGPGPLVPDHQDVGRILIDGSLLNSSINIEGSVRDLYLGFAAYTSSGPFAQSIDIHGDLQHMHINTNLGLFEGDPWLYTPPFVYTGPGVINVDGRVGEIQVAGFNCDYDINVRMDTLVHGNINFNGDVDWYYFTATAGVPITVDVTTVPLPAPAGVDVVVGLFNAGGVLQAWNNNGGWDMVNDARLTFTPPSTGLYWLAITVSPDGVPGLDPNGILFDGDNLGSPQNDPIQGVGAYTLTIEHATYPGAFNETNAFGEAGNTFALANNLDGTGLPMSQLTTPYQEIERVVQTVPVNGFLAHDYISAPPYDSDLVRWNNTFAVTPNVLGVLLVGPEILPGGDFSVTGVLEGNLQNLGTDYVDFYAFPAMPGDVVTVTQTAGSALVAVGLFDPFGNVVATANSGAGPSVTYVIDVPGLWRVAAATDFDFETATTVGSATYALTVTGATGGTATRMGGYSGADAYGVDIFVQNGMFGGVEVANNIYSTTTDGTASLIFPGYTDPTDMVISADGIVQVRAGGEIGGIAPWGGWVGLIAHSAVDVRMEGRFGPVYMVGLTPRPVGGPIGLVQAGGSWMGGGLYADGGIYDDFDVQYLILGGNFGYDSAGTINLNGTDLFADGNIGSIVIGGNLSPISHIRANSDDYSVQVQGQIDLLDIGGDFGDLNYGGHPYVGAGVGGNVRFARVPGTIYYRGAVGGTSPLTPITLTPTTPGGPRLVVDDSGGTLLIAVPENGQVTYRYIPIGASTSTNSNPLLGLPQGQGVAMTLLNITGTEMSLRATGEFEIGELTVAGVAGPAGEPSFLFLTGSSELDVYHIGGSVNNLSGSTVDGDIVTGDLTVDTIALRGAGADLGYSEHIGVVNPLTGYLAGPPVYVAGTPGLVGVKETSPFRGLTLNGDVQSIKVAGAIGDLVINGYVGTVQADSDKLNSADLRDPWYAGIGDGLMGIVYATGADPTRGFAIVKADVGQGLAPGGSGMDAKAGIFSSGIIGTVQSSRPGIDFVDPVIVATGGIYKVEVARGGSILGGRILANDVTGADWRDTSWLMTGAIGTVHVQGAGAAIDGTWMSGLSVKSVLADRGADGIFNALVWTAGLSPTPPTWGIMRGVGTIAASGFGIQQSSVQTDGPIGSLVATNKALGEFANNTVSASTTIGRIDAATVRDSMIVATLGIGQVRGGTMISTLGGWYPMEVHTGRLGQVTFTGDIFGDFFVAGPFDSITSQKGAIQSDILVTGQNGYLGSAQSYGPIQGTIDAEGGIGTLASRTGGLMGEMLSGGNVDSIRMALGITGDIRIAGNLGRLSLGGDLGMGGGVFAVGGNLGQAQIGSRGVIADIDNDVIIGGHVQSLKVTGGINGNFFVQGGVQQMSLGGNLNTVPGHIAVAAYLDTATDVDYYRFTATAGNFITLETDTVGDGVLGALVRVPDTVIGVWRAGAPGFFLWNDDSIVAGGTDSWLGFFAPATDTYYVAVTHWPDGVPGTDPNALFNGTPAGNIGPYLLSIDGANTEGAYIDSDSAGIANNTRPTAQNLTLADGVRILGDVGRFSLGSGTTPVSLNGDLRIVGNLGAALITGNLNGDVIIEGNVGSLTVATANMGVPGHLGATLGDQLLVTGSLNRLTVGSRDAVGNLLSGVTVGGNLQTLAVSGDAPGNFDVTGNVGAAQIMGDLGQSGGLTHFNVGGAVARLGVGARGVTSDVFTDVTIGGQASNLSSTGDWGETGDLLTVGSLSKLTVGARGLLSDLFSTVNVTNDASGVGVFGRLVGNMTVGGSLEKLTAGPIWGAITVTGDVNGLTTSSSLLPGVFPIDYLFVNGADPTGSLQADGTITNISGS